MKIFHLLPGASLTILFLTGCQRGLKVKFLKDGWHTMMPWLMTPDSKLISKHMSHLTRRSVLVSLPTVLLSLILLTFVGAMPSLTRRLLILPKPSPQTHPCRTTQVATAVTSLTMSLPGPFGPFQNPSSLHCVSDVGEKMDTKLHIVMHPCLVRKNDDGSLSIGMATSSVLLTTKLSARASTLAHAPLLTNPMASTSALCAMTPSTQLLPALKIDYKCIVMPYHVEGWDLALSP